MTNREMLDKYKDLICIKLKSLDECNNEIYDDTRPDTLIKIGKALEKYIWMDAELKEDENDKKKGDE